MVTLYTVGDEAFAAFCESSNGIQLTLYSVSRKLRARSGFQSVEGEAPVKVLVRTRNFILLAHEFLLKLWRGLIVI